MYLYSWFRSFSPVALGQQWCQCPCHSDIITRAFNYSPPTIHLSYKVTILQCIAPTTYSCFCTALLKKFFTLTIQRSFHAIQRSYKNHALQYNAFTIHHSLQYSVPAIQHSLQYSAATKRSYNTSVLPLNVCCSRLTSSWTIPCLWARSFLTAVNTSHLKY